MFSFPFFLSPCAIAANLPLQYSNSSYKKARNIGNERDDEMQYGFHKMINSAKLLQRNCWKNMIWYYIKTESLECSKKHEKE